MFGSVSELAGKPCDRTFNGKPEFAAEIEQSRPAGFAEGALHGVEKFCESKNGGLKPGLGLENGPFSCPP